MNRFLTAKVRLRKTTAQRIRDENREKGCSDVAKKAHRSTLRDQKERPYVQF
jgi:hypothetical protein